MDENIEKPEILGVSNEFVKIRKNVDEPSFEEKMIESKEGNKMKMEGDPSSMKVFLVGKRL